MEIPIFDLKRQYKRIEKDVKKKLESVLESQNFILGGELEKLEKDIASFCDTKYALGLNSGTDALILALDAMGIKSGDEVITTPFTFIATGEAIARAGAKPLFVDIDPKTYNIDPSKIEKSITPKTKAILPVHLYGLPCDMDDILEIAKKNNLKVLEDACQAIGASYKGEKVGSMGDAGAFSFFPSKNIGCFGDGGIVTTNNDEISKNIKLLRDHGSEEKYKHKVIGYNSRLDNIQAAFLNLKLPFLQEWTKKRIEHAEFFNNELKSLPLVTPYTPEGSTHSFHLYTLRSEHRDSIVKYLNEKGVASRAYYPIPQHLQECFEYLGYKPGDFPEAEKASRECFSIPVFAELTEKEKKYIVEKLKESLQVKSKVARIK